MAAAKIEMDRPVMIDLDVPSHLSGLSQPAVELPSRSASPIGLPLADDTAPTAVEAAPQAIDARNVFCCFYLLPRFDAFNVLKKFLNLFYLRQGGNVFARLCLSVCLSVC